MFTGPSPPARHTWTSTGVHEAVLVQASDGGGQHFQSCLFAYPVKVPLGGIGAADDQDRFPVLAAGIGVACQ